MSSKQIVQGAMNTIQGSFITGLRDGLGVLTFPASSQDVVVTLGSPIDDARRVAETRAIVGAHLNKIRAANMVAPTVVGSSYGRPKF